MKTTQGATTATPLYELTELMRDHELTQARVAELLYITPRQVNNWCNGRSSTPRWAVELLRFKLMLAQG